jgi:hypothetical protein
MAAFHRSVSKFGSAGGMACALRAVNVRMIASMTSIVAKVELLLCGCDRE